MALKILIPARGGSKRIPRKNLVDVNGKPLIQYVIETCRKITDDIYVSTEDSEIQEFVEIDCQLEDDETEQDLIDDLYNTVHKINTTRVR